MYRKLWTVIFGMWTAIAFTSDASAQSYRIVKVADDVYDAIGLRGVSSNSQIIVNREDVVVVDTSYRPAWARELISEIRKITAKPVRYVVYTHWHTDHTGGSQAFLAAYPGVQFIGQDYARRDLQAVGAPRNRQVLETKTPEQLKDLSSKYGAPAQIAELEKQLAEGKDPGGKLLDDAAKINLQQQIDMQKAYQAELPQIHNVLPTMTYDDKLVLFEGDREIDLIHFGPAHTRGDTFVYLPKEKIVMTGDSAQGVPGGHDGYPAEWASSLGGLAKLDWTLAIPAHGTEADFQHDKAKVQAMISYLNDMVAQVRSCVAKGMTLDQTMQTVNLDSHAADFGPAFKGGSNGAVARAWAELMNLPKSIAGEPLLPVTKN